MKSLYDKITLVLSLALLSHWIGVVLKIVRNCCLYCCSFPFLLLKDLSSELFAQDLPLHLVNSTTTSLHRVCQALCKVLCHISGIYVIVKHS